MLYSVIKYFERSVWNIGFIKCEPGELLEGKKKIERVQWLKHSYKDRFFADPFFLSATEEKLEVLVEEYLYKTGKGRIVLLIIDAKELKIIEHKIVLELDTHLSYPILLRWKEKLFIYPENGAGQRLSLYEFHLKDHTTTYYGDMLPPEEIRDVYHINWLADATLTGYAGKYWLFLTPDVTNDKLMIFQSECPDKGYCLLKDLNPSTTIEDSRPAGNFIEYNGSLYRPVQNCKNGYGSSIKIQMVDVLSEKEFKEHTVVEIFPCSSKYSRGIHTINFYQGLCVVDGRGYRYRIARFLMPVFKLLLKLKK